MLAGVAAGLARHFGIDVNIIRIGFAVLAILGLVGSSLGFGGIPFYLAGHPAVPGPVAADPRRGTRALHRGEPAVLSRRAARADAGPLTAGPRTAVPDRGPGG